MRQSMSSRREDTSEWKAPRGDRQRNRRTMMVSDYSDGGESALFRRKIILKRREQDQTLTKYSKIGYWQVPEQYKPQDILSSCFSVCSTTHLVINLSDNPNELKLCFSSCYCPTITIVTVEYSIVLTFASYNGAKRKRKFDSWSFALRRELDFGMMQL